MSNMKSIKLVVVLALLALTVVCAPALADGYPFYGVLGASMYATGDTLSATVGKCYAGYNSMISLYTWDGESLTKLGDLGMSHDTGAIQSFNVTKGSEIVVGINVNQTGKNYYSGSGSYLVDGPHAKVDFDGFVGTVNGISYDNPSHFGGAVLVGFEDMQMSGSDKDFNDVTVCSVQGVGQTPPPVPEPGTIVAACSILAPVGFVFRRRRA